MITSSDNEPDAGHFSTTSVRPRSQSHKLSTGLTSRTITFPTGNYSRPPNIAGGFSFLELAVRLPNNKSEEEPNTWSPVDGIRANVVGSRISKESFQIGLETWNGGVMLAAAACWLEHKAGAKECVFGQFDTHEVIAMWRKKEREQALQKRRAKREREIRRLERSRRQSVGRHSIDTVESSFSAVLSTGSHLSSPREISSEPSSDSGNGTEEEVSDNDEYLEGSDLPTTYHHTVHFPTQFATPPKIVTWLNRVDFPYPSTSTTSSFRLSCAANGTSTTSSALLLSTSQPEASKHSSEMSIPLLGGALCYVAYPTNKQHVASGLFSVTSHTAKRSQISGRVTFPSNTFAPNRIPTVMAGLSGFECPAEVETLRVGVKVKWITAEEFGWEVYGPQAPYMPKNGNNTGKGGGKWRVEVNWIALGFV